MRRLTRAFVLLLAALSSSALALADLVERQLKVTFVSAELVYLNGGRAEGLTVGAKPVVFRDDQRVTELEVQHLAEHSSACRFVGPVVTVLVGDVVRVSVDTKSATDSLSPPPAPSVLGSTPTPAHETDAGIPQGPSWHPHASGSIAALYSNWDDHTEQNLDFRQGRFDTDLRVEPLWTPGLSFAMRTSGRQDRRFASVSGAFDDSWESRIATFALEYRREGSRVGMSMGRINPARVGAIGRLDGGSFEYRASEPVRIGVFAGANSQWQYGENRPNLQTYGVYAAYRRGSSQTLLFDQTFSVVLQYHGSTTSREAVYAQGRVTHANRWNLSHSVEVDVNRGWRKQEGNAALSLSTAYLQGRVNLTRVFAATVSYDTRKSFRTFENRSIADSIFDDRVRQGIRGQLDLALPEGIALSAGAGVRSVEDESDRTVSYNGAIRKQGLINRKTTISLQGAAFDGKTNRGGNVNAALGQGFRQRDWIGLGAGIYRYTLAGEPSARINRKIDLTLRVGITRFLALNAMGQLHGGDDTRGHRFEAGMSVQF